MKHLSGSGEILVRSRIEIASILGDIVAKGTPLISFFPKTDQLFMAVLRQVDAAAGIMLVNYSSNRSANGEILAANSVRFTCSEGDAGIEFIGAHPVETSLNHEPMIRCMLPEVLILRQRRVHRRVSTLPKIPLSCVADTGGAIPFEAEIVDISSTGLGAMLCGGDVRLAAGTVLRDCRINLPDGSAVLADIEVRNVARVTGLDGHVINRAGCRFMTKPRLLEELIKVFIVDLDAEH